MLFDSTKGIWNLARVVRLGLKVLLFLTLTALLLLTREAHWGDVFFQKRVFFVEADAYARMHRVEEVQKAPLQPLRHHEFENAPAGITPHTTLPMDWAILCCRGMISPFAGGLPPEWRPQTFDIAGAFVSPVLGLLTFFFLFWWSRQVLRSEPGKCSRFSGLGLLIFAVSPVLSHATALGRPDHQSLLLLFLAVALGLEWLISSSEPRLYIAILAGLAWGCALWVSLYEPLILYAVVLAMKLAGLRGRFFSKAHLASLGAAVLVFGFAFLYEGIQVQMPAGEAFDRWRRMIAELQHTGPFSSMIWRTGGWGLAILPVLLVLRRRTWAPFGFLLILWGLAVWQLRWGPYLGLVMAMGFCVARSPLPRRWWASVLVWLLAAVSLWPVLQEWDAQIFDHPNRDARKAENFWLRVASGAIREPGVILAPWWDSPAISYWAGQPAVAGSSHESLPGITDTARFYLSPDLQAGASILRERNVRWVIVGNPDGLIENSAGILGVPEPEMPLARQLYLRPSQARPFLQLITENDQFKVFEVAEP